MQILTRRRSPRGQCRELTMYLRMRFGTDLFLWHEGNTFVSCRDWVRLPASEGGSPIDPGRSTRQQGIPPSLDEKYEIRVLCIFAFWHLWDVNCRRSCARCRCCRCPGYLIQEIRFRASIAENVNSWKRCDDWYALWNAKAVNYSRIQIYISWRNAELCKGRVRRVEAMLLGWCI
jgi:hypothetical protein